MEIRISGRSRILALAALGCLVLGLVAARVVWANSVPCINTPPSQLIIVGSGGCIPQGVPFKAWVNTPPPSTNPEIGHASHTIRNVGTGSVVQSGSQNTDPTGLLSFGGMSPGDYTLAVTINGKTVCEWFCVR